MTLDEIVRIARDVGIASWNKDRNWWTIEPGIESFFRTAYAAGAAAERERNAQIADAHASCEGIAQVIAAEIRSQK